jgi:coenzyme F420 hydrogenase subunit beta
MIEPNQHDESLRASSVSELFTTVVDGGYCVGCGMCAALSPSMTMQMTAYGQWRPALDQTRASSASMNVAAVCPFAESAPSEDELAQQLFPAALPHQLIGRSISCFAGHVATGQYRSLASSGGLVSWILCRLLELGEVDAVVHVGAVGDARADSPLFEFTISNTPAEVISRAKSRYYPVEMSAVVRSMIENPLRYAVVGLPCFIKGLRLACRESQVLQSRVKHTVGIVCGHLKSTGFAEMIAWQLGVPPDSLRGIDFRTKRPDVAANNYAATVTGIVDTERKVVSAPTSSLFGTNWGHGFFKYKACDFCDDVLAETADIAVGDAWLPEYVKDSGGTSIAVVRTPFFSRLIENGVTAGDLVVDKVSPDQVAASQDAGLRHRREGLAYRLAEASAKGEWVPPKRVAPEREHLTPKKRKIYSLRVQLAELSHRAFLEAKNAGDFSIFVRKMSPLVTAYNQLYAPSLLLRSALRTRSALRKLVAAVSARMSR